MSLTRSPVRSTSAPFASKFDVITACDVETILRMLRTHPSAALVLEPAIFAPYSWEPLTEISWVCAARTFPLVICSTLDERRRGFELGAAAYLVKPTLPATLLDTLRQVVGIGRTGVWMRGIRPPLPH